MTDTLAGERTMAEATVRSAVAGDEMAFAWLVAEHHRPMARVAFVICGDAEATRDAMQAAWVHAWHRMRSLRDPHQVRPWLVAIAANEARQVMRRGRRDRVVDISDELDRVAVDDLGAIAELLDLRRALGTLSTDDRSLLAMRYAAGLDSYEIADQLGLSASGVRSRLSRLLERLRTELALEPETGR